eukprot:TRINITY_DN22674_c0_g1_i1.p1 TRINITY_DN22674_c0_g1~~TRINITY_DN22674_c0_g1_i1.p1  ORF type:complete len:556 (-),score=86.47 TRINITY_DN22674_c0_g1_i1:77-1546(-)
MAENSTICSRIVSTCLLVAVLISLACWMIGTVDGVRIIPCEGTAINSCIPREPRWMEAAETICVWIFTAEVLLRLISAGHARSELLNQRYLISIITGDIHLDAASSAASTFQRFVRFLLSPEAICDLLSVVPYWVEVAIDESGGDSEVDKISLLRLLYIVRVTRVFKLGRALNADLGQLNEVNDLFRKVLINASPAILMTVLLIIIALFFFGTFIWFCERGEWVDYTDARYQVLVNGSRGNGDGAWLRKGLDGVSEELSPFDSIPASFWWTMVTITTVGYGDQVPYTGFGKLVGSAAMLYGTVILGLPLFVVGATFGQEYDRLMKTAKRRHDQMHSREEAPTCSDIDDRTAQVAKATGNFIEEFAQFKATCKENCQLVGISDQMIKGWQDALRAALLDQKPAVALDRLSVRVLGYISEVEEMWSASGDKAALQVACCRHMRCSWHRLSITCCQLEMTPMETLTKVLDETLGEFIPSGRGSVKRPQNTSR